MEQLKYRENLNQKFKPFKSKNLIYEGFTLKDNKVEVLYNCRKITIRYINENIVSVFIGDIYEEEIGTNAVIMKDEHKNLEIEETTSEIFIKGEKF